jgi:addiction module HigA family antidote
MAFERRGPSAFAVHPGEILKKEFLEPLDLAGNKLAKQIGVKPQTINDITLEKRGISADIAARLARFFGTTEQFWMNLQDSYDLAKVHKEKRKELEKIGRYEMQAA